MPWAVVQKNDYKQRMKDRKEKKAVVEAAAEAAYIAANTPPERYEKKEPVKPLESTPAKVSIPGLATDAVKVPVGFGKPIEKVRKNTQAPQVNLSNYKRQLNSSSDPSKKYGAGTNRSGGKGMTYRGRLDKETEEVRHTKIPMHMSVKIKRERERRGLSQKDLCVKICIRQNVLQEYESGKAIVSKVVLEKLSQELKLNLEVDDADRYNNRFPTGMGEDSD